MTHKTYYWETECIKIRRSLWQRRRRLEKFKLEKKAKILEIGCGDGLNIQILNSLGYASADGVDISKYLLKLAQGNNPQTQFFLASAEKLPFKRNTYDALLIDSTFHHLINLPEVLKEMHRVLKKGGFLCFCEPHKSILRTLYDFITLFPGPLFLARKQAWNAEKNNLNSWLDNERLFINSLEENGFKKIFLKVDVLSIIGKYQRI